MSKKWTTGQAEGRHADDVERALAHAEARLHAQSVELEKIRQEFEQARERCAELEARLGHFGDAGIVHEVKQPLTAIANYASAALRMIQRNKMSPAEIEETLTKITALADRGGEIVRRFREAEIGGKLRLETVDLRRAIGSALELLQQELMDPRVAVRLEVPDDLPQVPADRVQIEQVLVNLLRNSLEALAESGERTIVVSARPAAGNTVEVCVRDSGKGLTVEAIKRLFQPIQSAKPDGMGVGLAICRNIVSAHGGWMWAKPNLDRGASFFFALPLGP